MMHRFETINLISGDKMYIPAFVVAKFSWARKKLIVLNSLYD